MGRAGLQGPWKSGPAILLHGGWTKLPNTAWRTSRIDAEPYAEPLHCVGAQRIGVSRLPWKGTLRSDLRWFFATFQTGNSKLQ